MHRARPAVVLYVNVYAFRITGDIWRLLLLKRRTDIVLPGVWQPISGKIREGERIWDAFSRQAAAKTGQVPTRTVKLDTVNTYYDEEYDCVMCVPVAAVELDDEHITLDPSLHTEYLWVNPDQAPAYLAWENQVNCVELLAKLLKPCMGKGIAVS